MERNGSYRWQTLGPALRRHWPQLTDRELEETQGKFENLEDLVARSSGEDRTSIREKLAFILEETQRGNPNTVDEFAGVEREKNNPAAPPSTEWESREDVNDRP